ncbi:hypothetical protein Pan216_17350 [Planctomycetes bacterium Pan216]|uniref:Uncharacterized protein n=2 Tax=Kolteria novifilia TaxID=2527975 RepID=A0A518B1Q9_9BACT|nr:hypothetical protein Pan216_17350 [Planctomycetes bacterium Pan216]
MTRTLCSYCGKETPVAALDPRLGRCPECIAQLGYAVGPAPASVTRDKVKVSCRRCGAEILPLTAWRTLGYCMPCLGKESEPMPIRPMR